MKMFPLSIQLALGIFLLCTASVTTVRGAEPDPEFSVVKSGYGRHWVCDAGQKVALVGPTGAGGNDACVALIRQYPGQDVPDELLTEPGVMGFAQNIGLRLQTYWITNKTFDGIKPTVAVDDKPVASKFHYRWDKPKTKEFGTVDITVLYDSTLSRYVVEAAFDLSVNKRPGGEFCDFYTYGMGDVRPGVSRYNRMLWTAPDGSLKLHWLGFPCAQPFPPPSRALRETTYWHHGGSVRPFFSGVPLPIILPRNGMMAMVNEPQGNPAVVLEEASPPVRIDVCFTWFDVHFVWHEPLRVKDRSFATELPGPPYRYRARLKGYWLQAPETKKLLARAKQLPLDQAAFDRYIPIAMNKTTDFEWRINANKPPIKHIYLWTNPDGGVTWDSTTARSGNHSILFDGDRHPNINVRTTGPELLVTPGKQVKFGAWVKTQDVSGEGFWLESSMFLTRTPATPANSGPFRSRKLTGTNDWTWLEVPMPITPADAIWLPRRMEFILKGTGKVWMDDLIFAEEEP